MGSTVRSVRSTTCALRRSSTTTLYKNGNSGVQKHGSVTSASAKGVPAVTDHLYNEGTLTKSFKIKTADSLDGNKLRDNLIAHINAVDGMKDQWPSDVNEAARIVSQHVLAAVGDVK